MKKRKLILLLSLLLLAVTLCSCGTEKGEDPSPSGGQETGIPDSGEGAEGEEEKEFGVTEMKLWIGNEEIPVKWEENDAVKELAELASASPLVIRLSMYGGFEQVGPIGKKLTRNDKQTRTGPGDIVLYSGDQIVLFYGTNSWSYTRLGHMEKSEEELRELLGNGDVTVTIGF